MSPMSVVSRYFVVLSLFLVNLGFATPHHLWHLGNTAGPLGQGTVPLIVAIPEGNTDGFNMERIPAAHRKVRFLGRALDQDSAYRSAVAAYLALRFPGQNDIKNRFKQSFNSSAKSRWLEEEPGFLSGAKSLESVKKGSAFVVEGHARRVAAISEGELASEFLKPASKPESFSEQASYFEPFLYEVFQLGRSKDAQQQLLSPVILVRAVPAHGKSPSPEQQFDLSTSLREQSLRLVGRFYSRQEATLKAIATWTQVKYPGASDIFGAMEEALSAWRPLDPVPSVFTNKGGLWQRALATLSEMDGEGRSNFSFLIDENGGVDDGSSINFPANRLRINVLKVTHILRNALQLHFSDDRDKPTLKPKVEPEISWEWSDGAGDSDNSGDRGKGPWTVGFLPVNHTVPQALVVLPSEDFRSITGSVVVFEEVAFLKRANALAGYVIDRWQDYLNQRFAVINDRSIGSFLLSTPPEQLLIPDSFIKLWRSNVPPEGELFHWVGYLADRSAGRLSTGEVDHEHHKVQSRLAVSPFQGGAGEHLGALMSRIHPEMFSTRYAANVFSLDGPSIFKLFPVGAADSIVGKGSANGSEESFGKNEWCLVYLPPSEDQQVRVALISEDDLNVWKAGGFEIKILKGPTSWSIANRWAGFFVSRSLASPDSVDDSKEWIYEAIAATDNLADHEVRDYSKLLTRFQIADDAVKEDEGYVVSFWFKNRHIVPLVMSLNPEKHNHQSRDVTLPNTVEPKESLAIVKPEATNWHWTQDELRSRGGETTEDTYGIALEVAEEGLQLHLAPEGNLAQFSTSPEGADTGILIRKNLTEKQARAIGLLMANSLKGLVAHGGDIDEWKLETIASYLLLAEQNSNRDYLKYNVEYLDKVSGMFLPTGDAISVVVNQTSLQVNSALFNDSIFSYVRRGRWALSLGLDGDYVVRPLSQLEDEKISLEILESDHVGSFSKVLGYVTKSLRNRSHPEQRLLVKYMPDDFTALKVRVDPDGKIEFKNYSLTTPGAVPFEKLVDSTWLETKMSESSEKLFERFQDLYKIYHDIIFYKKVALAAQNKVEQETVLSLPLTYEGQIAHDDLLQMSELASRVNPVRRSNIQEKKELLRFILILENHAKVSAGMRVSNQHLKDMSF